MLLAAARIQPNWQFIGQDVDSRCVHMTAINLGLRNRYGHVVYGNSLTEPLSFNSNHSIIYETGRVQVWGNAIRKTSLVPLPDREPTNVDIPTSTTNQASGRNSTKQSTHKMDRNAPQTQIELF